MSCKSGKPIHEVAQEGPGFVPIIIDYLLLITYHCHFIHNQSGVRRLPRGVGHYAGRHRVVPDLLSDAAYPGPGQFGEQVVDKEENDE